MPHPRPEHEELSGWTEIASHLIQSAPTARRWECLVLRVHHGKSQPPPAFSVSLFGALLWMPIC